MPQWRRITVHFGSVSTKTARIDLRLTEEQHDLLEHAATIAGSSLASFCVASLMDVAAARIAQARAVTLSEDDWQQFTAALDAPDDQAWQRLRAMTPVWA